MRGSHFSSISKLLAVEVNHIELETWISVFPLTWNRTSSKLVFSTMKWEDDLFLKWTNICKLKYMKNENS